jgi:zinc transport system substrate-binding protein
MRHALLALALLLGAGCSKKKEEPPAPAPAPTPAAPTPAPTATPTPTPAPARPPEIAPLKVGVTLHPYYSWTANVIAGVPGAEVVAVLPGDVDAGSYQPSPADIAKLSGLDALVVNGIGHDDFITGMIKSSGNDKLVRIDANQGTPLVDSGHTHAKGKDHDHGPAHKNSHTFISFTNAIQQTKQIATKLGELRPPGADRFRDNATAYVDRLRKLQNDAATKLAGAKQRRVVTVHDGYAYLLQELGIEVAGVVEPAHGLVPSAKELASMIALMKKEQVAIVFTEESFPEKLLATLRDATGARVYVLSHVAVGAYTPEKFETEMAKNAETLVQALVTDAK